MSILSNKDWAGAQIDKRVVERCTKVCSLGDVRSWAPTDGPGKGPSEVVLVNLTLEEGARTTDGDPLNPGFPVVGRINVWPDRPAEAQATLKELAVAALGMDRKAKQEEVDKAFSDWASLKGRKLSVTFDVRKKNGEVYQEIARYDRLPVA